MSEFLYEVGDEFEGSPAEHSRFIREVAKAGGKVSIEGKIVRITYLPEKEKKYIKKAPVVEPIVEEPVVEVKEESVVEETVEAVVEEAAPKRRGRSRKFETSDFESASE